MKVKMRIGVKMLLFVMSTSVLVMLVIGLFIGFRINKIARDDAVRIVQSEAQKTASQVKSELELDMGFSRALAHALYIYPKFDTLTLDSIFINILKNQVANNPRYLTVWYSIEYSAYRPGYTKNYGRRSVTAYLRDGNIGVDIEHKNVTGDVTTSNYYSSKTCNCEMLLDPYTFVYGGREVLATSLSVPVKVGDRFAGLGGVDISLEKFQETIEKIKPYSNTRVSLIASDGIIIADTNPENARLKFSELFPSEEATYQLSQKIKNGLDFQYLTIQDNREFLNIITPVKVGDSPTYWSVCLSIPLDVVVAEARKAVIYTILVFLFGIILQTLAIWYISNYITRPIKKTTGVLNNLAEGDIDINSKIYIHTGDELEEMARSTSKLIDGLNHTVQFAREIGQGKLDSEFTLLSSKDRLGEALIDMQKSLLKAREAEVQRKDEENKQNWATRGVAMFGEVLRQHNDNLNELSYLIVKNLVSYTGSIQGGIYLINDNDSDNPFLEMTACYAYDRRKFMEKNILPNEGLVGRCYVEGKTILMTDVPKNYIKITSGLGGENPRCLLIVPLKVNDTVLGVIELASFNPYQKYQVDFIEKIAESIAATLSSVRVNIRTAELLERTQQQAEEMKAQEEEMRQNMEELHATQEEMERKRLEQESINTQLAEDRTILNSLMQNLPDCMFQKDVNGRYVRLSNSMLNLLGIDQPDEVIGLTDFDLFPTSLAKLLSKLDSEVLSSRQPITSKPIELVLKNGVEQDALLTLMPLVEENGDAIGVMGVMKLA
jgi:PAS domain S-box-containing protein